MTGTGYQRSIVYTGKPEPFRIPSPPPTLTTQYSVVIVTRMLYTWTHLKEYIILLVLPISQHRLGELNNKFIFSTFWRLEVRD